MQTEDGASTLGHKVVNRSDQAANVAMNATPALLIVVSVVQAAAWDQLMK